MILLRAGLFLSELLAWVVALALVLWGEWRWAIAVAIYAFGADLAGRAWSRRSPVPLPAHLWWLLLIPRGPHSPGRLLRFLHPQVGERILEIGPGVGVHAVSVAASIRPGGVLDVIDVEQEMLDRLIARARRAGLTNIVATQGDAQKLPYPDHAFDAAYMVGVLGEIPDPAAALQELERVLTPDGRLVIGELFIDPDFIALPRLQELAGRTGFRFERRAGPGFAYWAGLRPPPSP